MAATGALPKNVQSILSSFVHEQQPETSKNLEENQASGSKCSRDYEGFLLRVRSFNSMTWFAKPGWLSPPICARYGWENVGPDLLQCVGCKVHISGRLPPVYEPTVYDECCKKVENSLKNGHSICCSWANNPSPVSYLTVSLGTAQEECRNFLQRVCGFLPLDNKLPTVTDTILEELQLTPHTAERLTSMVADQLSIETTEGCVDENLKSACVLALCGWQKRSESTTSEETTCDLCNRNLGLWNFFSPANPDVSEESEEDMEENDPEENTEMTLYPEGNKDQTQEEENQIQQSGMVIDPEETMDNEEEIPDVAKALAEQIVDMVNNPEQSQGMSENSEAGENVGNGVGTGVVVSGNTGQDSQVLEATMDTDTKTQDSTDSTSSEIWDSDPFKKTSQVPENLEDQESSEGSIEQEEEKMSTEERHDLESKVSENLETEQHQEMTVDEEKEAEGKGEESEEEKRETSEEETSEEFQEEKGEESDEEKSEELEEKGVESEKEKSEVSEEEKSEESEGGRSEKSEGGKSEEAEEEKGEESEDEKSEESEGDRSEEPEGEKSEESEEKSEESEEEKSKKSEEKDTEQEAVEHSELESNSIQEKEDSSNPSGTLDSEETNSSEKNQWLSLEGKGLESIIATLKKTNENTETKPVPKFEVSDSESDEEFGSDRSESFKSITTSESSEDIEREGREGASLTHREESEKVAKDIIEELLRTIIPDDGDGEDTKEDVEGSHGSESVEISPPSQTEDASDTTQEESHEQSDTAENGSRKRALEESEEDSNTDQDFNPDVAAQNKRNLELTEEEDEQPKRKKFKKLQRTQFDPLNEHRPWCPWVTAAQPISIMDTTDQSQASTHPSWRRLLFLLVPESSPVKVDLRAKFKTSPSIESLRSIRRILNDWTSPKCSS